MKSCPSCESFVPATICPECGHVITKSTAKRVFGRVLNVAVGGATAITLAACYGLPYEDPFCSDPSADLDGDGYCFEFDCDESDPAIHRFASDEAGDGVDTNCDGVDGYPGDAGTTP